MKQEEVWKELIGFDYKYIMNIYGDVINITNGKCVFVKKSLNGSGYYRVHLKINNKHKDFVIHRLIAINFIPNPNNKPEINHKNGIKSDNSIDNLEWVNRSENVLHAFRNKLKISAKGERHGRSKLTEEDVFNIRKIGNSLSAYKVGKMFSVGHRAIRLILIGETWTHI